MRPGHGASRGAVVAALVAVQTFFALHYVAAKFIMDHVPPRAWATVRILSAATLLMAFVLATRRSRMPRAPRDLAAIALFSVFGVVINQVCFVEGLVRTTTSHSAIINTSIPVATLLIALLMGRERLTGRKAAGIALSLSGVLYLIGHGGMALGDQVVLGDLLNLANALSYSFFLVISRPILQRHSSLAVTAELLAFGAVGVSLLGAGQLSRVDPATLPASVWWTGAFVVLFATVAAYLLNAWALKRVESSSVALFIYLQPIIASLAALVLRGERLGPETFIAAALIFAGVALGLQRPAAPGDGALAGQASAAAAAGQGHETRPPSASS
ncbi:MAG TPA: DMT family transporter [Candidatus Polarisedimenticolia bacterium]|nr:DMT family transporter [Candidatus Polarisedimenticolia bacterium]